MWKCVVLPRERVVLYSIIDIDFLYETKYLINEENVPLVHSWRGRQSGTLGRACCWDGQGSTNRSWTPSWVFWCCFGWCHGSQQLVLHVFGPQGGLPVPESLSSLCLLCQLYVTPCCSHVEASFLTSSSSFRIIWGIIGDSV